MRAQVRENARARSLAVKKMRAGANERAQVLFPRAILHNRAISFIRSLFVVVVVALFVFIRRHWWAITATQQSNNPIETI